MDSIGVPQAGGQNECHPWVTNLKLNVECLFHHVYFMYDSLCLLDSFFLSCVQHT